MEPGRIPRGIEQGSTWEFIPMTDGNTLSQEVLLNVNQRVTGGNKFPLIP
jgi:hypothetical protein